MDENNQVTIEIPQVDEVVEVATPPQVDQASTDTISTTNPQEVGIGNSCVSSTGHVMDNTTTPNKCTLCGYMAKTIPIDDITKAIENAPTIPAADVQPNPEGRPCEFCKDKEAILKTTEEYISSGKDEKRKVLFLNELAIILGKHRETIMNWANKRNEDNSLEHEQFFDMIKTVEQIQELRLQQRVLGRYNPTGAIFLLKTKHGYIESEKKIVAGDTKEPLEIIITEQKPIIENE